MMEEFHKQLQHEIEKDDEQNKQDEFYDGYIDDINMDALENILRKMPKLNALKFAQG